VVVRGDWVVGAVERGEDRGERGGASRAAPVAEIVAPSRPLELDDVGAEVAQEHGAAGAGEDAREVEDADPLQHRRAAGSLGAAGCRPRSRARRVVTHARGSPRSWRWLRGYPRGRSRGPGPCPRAERGRAWSPAPRRRRAPPPRAGRRGPPGGRGPGPGPRRPCNGAPLSRSPWRGPGPPAARAGWSSPRRGGR